MKSFFRRPMLAALFMAAMTAVTVIALEPLYAQYGSPPAGAAATKAKGKQAAKQDASTTARREVGTPINDALKLVESKNWDGAIAKVQIADAVKDKTPYEEFMVAKYLAFISVSREPQDLAAATVAVNRQIVSGGAPEAEKAGMYSMGMLLNYANMEYAKVVQSAQELQKLNQPLNEQQTVVLVQSYYNTMDYTNAAKEAKVVSDAKIAAGEKPSADVLGLLLNSQAKLMDDAGYRVTLDRLATVSTQPEVWGQIMDFALATKDIQEHHLLNLFRLSTLVGTMRDTDYAAMASIDLTNQLPNEAKEALAKGNRTSGDLFNDMNKMLANDPGLLTGLAAEAGKQTNGEIDIKLGESYLTYARYDEAVTSLRAGIQKGGLKDLPDAQTTLGIALYRAGKKEEALTEFRKAEMASTSAAPVAHTWVLFLQRPAA